MNGPRDSSPRQRKTRHHDRRSVASDAVRRWRCRRKASRLYDVGRTVELTTPGPSAASRSARIYQRGVRVLQTTFPIDVPMNGLSARDQLEWALAVSGPWPRIWSWSRQRRLLTAAAAIAGLLFTTSIVAVLMVRTSAKNLAFNRPWRASSSGAGFPVEGRLSDAPAAIAFMHTGDEENPSVTVDLEGVRTISRIEIANRVDCCSERAVPLVIEGSTDGQQWKLMARRSSAFSVWRARVPTQSVRFVRIRIDGHGILHLRGIRLF